MTKLSPARPGAKHPGADFYAPGTAPRLDSDAVVLVLAAAKAAASKARREAAQQARQGPAGRGPARAEGRSAGPRPAAAAGAAAAALLSAPEPGLTGAAQRLPRYLTNNLSPGLNDAGQRPFSVDRPQAPEMASVAAPAALSEAEEDEVYDVRRSLRFGLREVLWRESSLPRVRSCGRSRIDKDAPVKVRIQGGRTHYTNLQLCGSIWSCTVCEAKIRHGRAEEITGGAVTHMGAGGEIWMVTFTARHKKRHRLAPLMTAISEGFSSLLAGEAAIAERRNGVPLVDADGAPCPELFDWMAKLTAQHKKRHQLAPPVKALAQGFRAAGVPLVDAHGAPLVTGNGIPLTELLDDPDPGVAAAEMFTGPETGPLLGTIRSAEVTWSSNNGWHPHLHVLVFMTPGHTTEQFTRLMERWNKKWIKWMTKRGFAPTVEHGHKWVKVYSAKEAGEYLAKTQEGKHVGNEIARGDLKTGRKGSITALQVLEYFNATGDADALPLWHEYEKATKGKKAITWSQDLRRTLLDEGDDDDEPDDQDLAEAEVGGLDVAELPAKTWAVICTTRGLPAKVLRAAELDGLRGINTLLAPYGLSADPPSAPPEPG